MSQEVKSRGQLKVNCERRLNWKTQLEDSIETPSWKYQIRSFIWKLVNWSGQLHVMYQGISREQRESQLKVNELVRERTTILSTN